jgi:hypothetical protein
MFPGTEARMAPADTGGDARCVLCKKGCPEPRNHLCRYQHMLKYIIETAPLGTRYVVAAKDPENGSVVQVFTLNKTAAHMLELFSQGLPTAEVAERIAREYKAPLDLVKRDVFAFWEDIVRKGLA